MIDVAKHQLEVSRKGGKSKPIPLTNELKIITFSDPTWELWKDVISCAARGDLVDVDDPELKKFHEHDKFVPDKDGVLTREFFKFLGNLSEADHAKLCKHILCRSGPSRMWKHPKVVIKQPTTLREECYTVKEWIERRKRKAVAQAELQKIKPNLQLFKNGSLDEPAWKKFKADYWVSKESKHVLLDWAIPDSFWTNARATMHRNTPTEDLSPYAIQFFRTFLDVRSKFVQPQANMFFRPFNRGSTLSLGTWPSDAWHLNGSDVALGIIDFRFLPGYDSRHKYTIDKPFFTEIFKMLESKGRPKLDEIPSWLFICGDEADYLDVEAWVQRGYMSDWKRTPSLYIPAPNERLGGHSAKSRLATEAVRLLFVFDTDMENNLPVPSSEYTAPPHQLYEKPRKYQEFKYSTYPAELRMEFYLKVLQSLVRKDGAVFQLYAGTKPLMASMVRHSHSLPRVELNCLLLVALESIPHSVSRCMLFSL